MLDENLPTFYLRSSSDGVKHNASVLLSQHGSEAGPAYFLRHPDPALPASRNRYAVALYDSYVPDILYGEVLLIPEWSQPNATKEEIRLNGGVPPPPQAILPTEFVIQLYNPDQQIHVKWHPGTWSSAPYWFFEIPQQTFRQPSTSTLDRTQDDPASSETTPKLGFKWKKDGKLSKDYVCTLSDKSTNPDGSKRKNKEPDIIVSIFKNYKEITVYEPNLARVDVEDPKGLEVVLILGAIVLREVFNTNLRDAFNISEASTITASTSAANLNPQLPPRRHRHSTPGSSPSANNAVHYSDSTSSQVPPTDPRTQWEIDAEAARLRKQVEEEDRDRRRADAAEAKRVKKMLEEEEKKAKEKQKEIERETERLRKIYGKEEKASLQQMKTRPPFPDYHSDPPQLSANALPLMDHPPVLIQRPHSVAPAPYIASNLRTSQQQQGGPYLGQPGGPGSSPDSNSNPSAAPKKSFWRLGGGGGGSSGDGSRLTKQRSTVF